MQIGIQRTALSVALGIAVLALATAPARADSVDPDQPAQGTAPSDAQSNTQAQGGSGTDEPTKLEGVIVTGYRRSIQQSTEYKRDATNVVDTVFAEDIGKFPDLNIAESLNRIPGVQLTREVNGEGLNISIRGLGTNFTKILLDGAQIAVASTGRTDSQNQNREVDLNLFPTEFFTQLEVNKTPMASMLEGGVTGVVNMRSARPFDNVGTHLTYQAQGGYNSSAKNYDPRASVLGSWTSDGGVFGALVGLAGVRSSVQVKGFESIGWTNPNLTYAQCGVTPPSGTPATNPGPCNVGGGNGFVIPATVPAGVGNNLNPGDTIDQSFLLAHNPGLTIAQLDRALIPRLGRQSFIDGDRDRYSSLISLEYRPSDAMHFWLDTLYSRERNDFNRIDMDLIARNSALIPLNTQVDANNVVTSATFANAQYFLEARPYNEHVNFYNIDPGAEFIFTDKIKLNVQGNISRSWFRRESPSVLVNTPLGVGTTVDYQNTSPVPTITPNVNLNDPTIGWTWSGGRLNIQDEKRLTKNEGARADLQFGEDHRNVKVGVAFDDIERHITAFDNSAAWENAACRGLNPDGTVPNPRPACVGGPLALIPQSALGSYLRPGPAGFITIDFNRFLADSNYFPLNATAPETNSANTGAATGAVEEKNLGFYVETNGEVDFLEHALRYNAGVRRVRTEQAISGPVTIGGVRQTQELGHNYSETLPSFNVAWTVASDVVLRMSGSRTMTRPDPSVMLPNTNFSDPSAQTATQGNPALAPFLSNNFDLAGEWYTGDEGFLGLTAFDKRIKGFTVNGTNTIPFLQLGVPFDTLTDLQQLAINQRGGPNAATVTVQQQVNANGKLHIRGYEATWVQPLDRIFKGLGFMANYTHLKQNSEGTGVPAVAVGISPNTYNVTGYWEDHNASLRLSYTWNDDQISSGLNQNGIPLAALMTDARGQWDMSASYAFPELPSKPQITLNLINITNEAQRQSFQFTNATYTYYKAGYTILLGVRGTF